jgi:hypothetical protein
LLVMVVEEEDHNNLVRQQKNNLATRPAESHLKCNSREVIVFRRPR